MRQCIFTRNTLIFFISFFICPGLGFSQETKKLFDFPDVAGYHTLVCDFHMHSVFSDGLVWPTVRVKEALNEGMDAIAITEHIEYRPRDGELQGDHNRSYEIAAEYLGDKELILVKGAEITRQMPPGHFNVFFIKDANPLDTPEWKDALKIAAEQGAFIVWNHPGWRQPDEIPVWYPEHSWLRSQDLLQGIEVVNENSYYPLALQWALDSGLTILGNSDIHDPIDMFFDKGAGEHRPVTLIFALEKSAEGIHQAMIDKRTAVYYKDMLIGTSEIMIPLFQASVQVRMSTDHDAPRGLLLENKTSMPFQIQHVDANGKMADIFTLTPKAAMEINGDMIAPGGVWLIKNILIGPGKPLVINL